jgi:hypothetical protein
VGRPFAIFWLIECRNSRARILKELAGEHKAERTRNFLRISALTAVAVTILASLIACLE